RRPSSRDTVRLNGDIVTAPAFGRLLDFMYEGRLDLRSLPVEDVLAAASYLHMYDIVKVCRGRLGAKDRELGQETSAPGAEPLQPPRPLPAWTPELCGAARRAGHPGVGVKATLPLQASGPPPRRAPGESDLALDLSLKSGPRPEPLHPPCILQTPPCSHRQPRAPAPVKDQLDSLTQQESQSPWSPPSLGQPPRVPSPKGLQEPVLDAEPVASEEGREPQGHLCTCPLCCKLFPSAPVLQLHLSAHFRQRDGARAGLSADGAVPTCPLCRKTFSCTYTLKRHERTHSGEKPYTCVQCGKSFQYSHNLSRHAVVHTRDKPHACRWCERRFTQSGDLYRHVRKFHCSLVTALLV
ncbi:Zinc finger and BTB domain-containing protein 42, partial [Tupaia chinensis]